jgi:hypothetical protein
MNQQEGQSIFREIRTMINAGFVDFVFTGAAIVPEVLLFAGYVAEALMLLVPMLIAACLISMYHQHVSTDELSDEADAAVGDREPHQA